MRAQIAIWLDAHLQPEWRDAHRLWSVQIALFWSALSGMWAAWPAFQGIVPLPWFVGICIAFPMVLTLARLAKQPGLDN